MKLSRLHRCAGILFLLGIAVALATQAATAADGFWNPRIASASPNDSHGNSVGVADSELVSVDIWPANEVMCAPPANAGSPGFLQLLVAKDNGVTEPVNTTSNWILHGGANGPFPAIEYKDIPASIAGDPRAQYHFVVYGPTAMQPTRDSFAGNVWTHADDARTYLPAPVVPTGVSDPFPDSVDTQIQIVWPHDAQGNFVPVDRAPLVNVAVDVFQHGTLLSLPPGPVFHYSVALAVAAVGQPLGGVTGTEDITTYTVNGQTFPRFVFNDVAVTPGVPYTFIAGALEEGGKAVSPFTSVWVHSADPHPMLPNPSEPPPCGA